MKINYKPDIFRIAPRHETIHERLLNWARWGRSGTSRAVSPMFRQYRSPWRQWHDPELNPTVDELDALAVEKTVIGLPARHRDVVIWWYIKRTDTWRARKAFGCTEEGLLRLCDDARDMLTNRLNG